MAGKPQTTAVHPGPGFRIRRDFERPPKELIEQYGKYPTPDISDLMNRLYALSPKIRNLVNKDKLIGPACTVKVFPGDNLMVHKALDLAKPGDVIVVDTGGRQTNAICGELVSQKAKHRGIAGFVIDGLIRDLPGLKEIGLPIYARGTTPVGPMQRGPGEINHQISCGGIVINPGDLIVADQTGIVAVRHDFMEPLLQRLHAWDKEFSVYCKEVGKGNFNNEWADRLLDGSNVEYID